VNILYGSQTGNAEFIAKDLHEKLNSLGINSMCATMNTMKKVQYQEKCLAVIFGKP